MSEKQTSATSRSTDPNDSNDLNYPNDSNDLTDSSGTTDNATREAPASAKGPHDKLDRKTLFVFLGFCVALVLLVVLNMK